MPSPWRWQREGLASGRLRGGHPGGMVCHRAAGHVVKERAPGAPVFVCTDPTFSDKWRPAFKESVRNETTQTLQRFLQGDLPGILRPA